MKKHVKIFLDFYGLVETDVIKCAICNKEANDLHHIECRGMGGSKDKDFIENLIPLCRLHHHQYGDVPHMKQYLKEIVKAMISEREAERGQEKIH